MPYTQAPFISPYPFSPCPPNYKFTYLRPHHYPPLPQLVSPSTVIAQILPGNAQQKRDENSQVWNRALIPMHQRRIVDQDIQTPLSPFPQTLQHYVPRLFNILHGSNIVQAYQHQSPLLHPIPIGPCSVTQPRRLGSSSIGRNQKIGQSLRWLVPIRGEKRFRVRGMRRGQGEQVSDGSEPEAAGAACDQDCCHYCRDIYLDGKMDVERVN